MQQHDDLPARPAAPRTASRRAEDEAASGPVSQAPGAGPSVTPEMMLGLQQAAGNASVSRLIARQAAQRDDDPAGRSPVLDVVGKGGGNPMAPTLRREMEGRLGADFGDVRLHTDSQASQSAEAVNAHAYTVGNDVVFRSDRWNPDSADGKKTLAHELTHVMQQREGPVAGTATGDGIQLSDPSDPFERAADSNAASAMNASPSAAAAQGESAQREGPDDEEEEEPPAAAQGESAQREGPDEEEEEPAAAAQGESAQREGPDDEEEEEPPAAAQGEFAQREGAAPDEEEDENAAAQGDFVQRELAKPDEDDEEKASGA